MPPPNPAKPAVNVQVVKPAKGPGLTPAGKPGDKAGLAAVLDQAERPESSLIPPEETIWQRYSANGESLLSGLASFMLHLFVLLIIVTGLLSMFDRTPDPVEEIETVEIGNGYDGGGGGNPEGVGEAPGNLNAPKDEVKSLDQDNPTQPNKTLPEDDPMVKTRVEKMQLKPNQANLGPQLRDALEGLAGKGKGGSGRGGGEGTGVGRGRGSGVGDGTGKSNRRGRRQERWELGFGVSEARQYLQQTDACGMILAVPDKMARFMLVRNIKERPIHPTYEDLKALNRNWFYDDRRESCASVAEELNLDVIPSQLAFFYPYEFELDLLKKELAFRNRKEDDIEYTKFAITFSGGKPVITVKEQRSKPGYR